MSFEKTILALTMFAVAAMASPAVAADVAAGIDLFQSPPGASFTNEFNSGVGGTPIPADFFDPGSDPFDGSIGLDGDPFTYSGNGPCLAPADTIVERLSDAPFAGCPAPPVSVPIQIVALSLVSSNPIIVTFNGGQNPELWNIKVCLSDLPQTQGIMDIDHLCPDGGTFFSTLPVLPKFIFTRQSDNAVRVFDTGVEALPPTVLTTSAGWVHQSTISQVTQVGPGSEVDGNCDGVLEVLPVGTSNFVPGIFPSPCDCSTPPGGSQQEKELTSEQEQLVAHGVLPAQDPRDDDGNGIPDLCEGGGQPPKPVEPKWTQLPYGDKEGFNVASDLDWQTLAKQPPGDPGPGPNWVVADDFRSDGRPITCVRWWGSYLDPAFEPGNPARGNASTTSLSLSPGASDLQSIKGRAKEKLGGKTVISPAKLAGAETLVDPALRNLGPGGADDCALADPIAGDGLFVFNNTLATTDGLPDPLCLSFGMDQIDNDVWFCWTAACDGTATVETCGLTAVDTKIAAYDGCGCPPATILACNDDSCGLQSAISFPVVAGQSYLLRIGTFPGSAGGTGQFRITCVGAGGCVGPGIDCWSTECGSSFADFSGDPIPADFFDPGSQPFDGVINLGGGAGLIDTQVERLGQLCFPGPLPATDTVAIELVQLDLVSCQPITVDFAGGGTDQWNVQVDLSGPQPQGQMTATKEDADGGTFNSDFFAQPVYTFTRVSNPADIRILDTVQLGIPPILLQTIFNACWSTDETLEQCTMDGFMAGVCGGGCCKPVCHSTGGSPPQHQHCTTPPLWPPCTQDVDGWLVSFHTDEPLGPGGFSEPLDLLGLYFCPEPAVSIQPTGVFGWDGHQVFEYVVELEDCHLLHSLIDPRPGATPPDPARIPAFCETEDFIYWLDIQAVVGHTYEHSPCPTCDCDLDGNGACDGADLATLVGCIGLPPVGACAAADLDCDGDIDADDEAIWQCLAAGDPPSTCCPVDDWIEVETTNWAKDHFWGWHTSPDHFNDESVMGIVVMGPGGEWLYPLWEVVDGSEHQPACVCPGDMDGNSVLNALDIQRFVECILGTAPVGTVCACADVDTNGVANFADVAGFVARLLQKAPCGQFFVDQAFELLTPSQLGACCISPTECILVSEIECVECRGGIYLGDKSECPTTTVRVVTHTATQWSHSFETVVDCPDPARGVAGCTDQPFEIDPWTTEPGGTSCEDFSHPDACPIPADFFGPGSDSFGGQVCFEGVPLGITPFGDFGDADTLVLRTASPFDRCDVSVPFPTPSADVSIEVVALHLSSVNPITVTFNGGQNPEAWDVEVTLSDIPNPSSGILSAIKEHCNGGTYDSALSVTPKFTFTRVSDQLQLVLDAGLAGCGSIDMSTSGDAWVHDPHPNSGVVNPVCTDFFPGLGDLVQVDQSICDCDGNGIRDVCEQDSDGDGVIDACDNCPLEPALIDPNEPGQEVTCDDGIDNDCDGDTDCADADCAGVPPCP